MYEGFRAIAHLVEQLGEARFKALIDSGNTGKVRDFCDSLIAQKVVEVDGPYHLTYDCRLSFQERILLGKFDNVDDNFTVDHFKCVETGVVEVGAELLCLGMNAQPKAALAVVRALGRKPLGFNALLAFAAAHPDEQRKTPIIALGSSWVDDHGDQYFPSLFSGISTRNLDLLWSDCVCVDEMCRFLVGPKSKPA